MPNIERWNQPVIVFVTVCSKDRRPVLANDRMHQLLRSQWAAARRWSVGRYVVMPEHVHLFCSPAQPDTEGVKEWVGFWKRMVSREIPEVRPLWMRDCWDTQLRHVHHYEMKWDYVMRNPVRRGLVTQPEEWAYQGTLNELRW